MDRNRTLALGGLGGAASLSARRAWIEILLLRVLPFFAAVALRKESVDRNVSVAQATLLTGRRSPQGERG